MGVLGEGSKVPKIAVGLILLTLLLHLIAMGAPHWAHSNSRMTQRSEHIGLWRFCSYPVGGGQACNDFINIIVGDWLKAVQAFSILALFSLLGAVGMVCMYAFVPDNEGDPRILGAGIAVCGVSALFILIEIGSFAAMFQQYFNTREESGTWKDVGVLGWAFGLAVTSMVTAFATMGCLLIEMVSGPKDAY